MKTKNLTLREAIESGKPFKRADCDTWLSPNYNDGFERSSVLATDWEIQCEPDGPREWEIMLEERSNRCLIFPPGSIKPTNTITVVEKLPGYRMISRDELEKGLNEAIEKGLGAMPFTMIKPVLKSLGFDEEEE